MRYTVETPAEAATIRAEQSKTELVQLREEIDRLKTLTASSEKNPQE